MRLVRYDAAAGAVLAVIDNTAPERARGFMRWLDSTFGKDVTTRTGSRSSASSGS